MSIDLGLEKINKINGQVVTQDDITKIDNNTDKIQTGFNGLSALDIGLGNVTNESKQTMFTNPTFTGCISEGWNSLATKYSHAEGLYTLASNGTLYTITAYDDTTKTITLDNVNGLQVNDKINIKINGGLALTNIIISAINGITISINTTQTITSGWLYAIKEVPTHYNHSHTEGHSTIASGRNSHTEGYFTIASGCNSHVMGQYNKTLTGDATSYSSTADAFVIGNGTGSSALSNAFRVTFDGSTYGLSAFNSTGADYAEYFEWLDKNLNKEDRIGYFVTLDSEKIKKTISTDTYILGIISATPSIIGDSCQDDWKDKCQTDDWGRIQYHEVKVDATYETINGEQVEITPEHTDIVPILNSNWDSTKEYIPREKRPEWSTVGMLGKLLVRDDGTCEVNGYCKSNDNGVATKSDAGYRVMKRISDNIVQILFK